MRDRRKQNREGRVALEREASADKAAVEIVEVAESPDEEAVVCESRESLLRRRGKEIVTDHMLVSMGIGVIPAPLADVVGGVAVQLNMTERLCRLHDVPYDRLQARATVYLLVQGLGLAWVGKAAALSLIKAAPGAGMWISLTSFPILLGGAAYAVGSVLAAHFERGGSLDDIEAFSFRRSLGAHYRTGKGVARRLLSTRRRP